MLDGASLCQHKPFSSSSLHSRSLSHRGGPQLSPGPLSPSSAHQEFCYRRPEHHRRPLTFSPVASDCLTLHPPQASVALPEKSSGGTWPKVMEGSSLPECTQLSIYKKPKQRKSIFDADTFKRPEAPPKLDFLSLTQLPRHSPQSSRCDTLQAPPTPPARSDSFRFKHRQQNSSASDSTVTPPATPGQVPGSPQEAALEGRGDTGKHAYYMDTPVESMTTSRKSCDEEVSKQRSEVHSRKRYRPKSAPALRRNMTPLHLPIPIQVKRRDSTVHPNEVILSCVDKQMSVFCQQIQNFSNDEQSPEPVDLVRFSPLRLHRYSMPFVPPSYSSTVAARKPFAATASHTRTNTNVP